MTILGRQPLKLEAYIRGENVQVFNPQEVQNEISQDTEEIASSLL